MRLSTSAARRRLAWLRRAAAAGTLTLAMLQGTDARAQAPTPASDEFRVNTITESFQLSPAVAADADGDFTVVWTGGPDGYDLSVGAQRYTTDGTPQGEEFQVNTATQGFQAEPAIAMAGDGAFVVVWSSEFQDGDSFGAYAQRYAADGAPQGEEFQVNTTTADIQFAYSVGVDAAGGFVIAWQGNVDESQNVYVRRYGADGTPLSEEVQVNTVSAADPVRASLGVAPGGDFVVAWQSEGQDGDGFGIFARRYGADGAPLGEEFQVNTTTAGDQARPSVGVDADGTALVVWDSDGLDGSGTGIVARRFAADGTPLGDEFQVNTFTEDDQVEADVDVSADGSAVVVWQSQGQDGSGTGIYAQRYAADGTPAGPELEVNTTTDNDQARPSVSSDADGDFVVVWDSRDQDGDGTGIYARRYAVNPVAIENDAALPTALALEAAYPNPARDAATLRYALPTAADVHVTVTDLLGRTVLSRTEGAKPAGRHAVQLTLDGLSSGVYVVRVNAQGATATKRLTVVR
ncbi:MAG: T9SS type A sorting domain-containing protein [Bacteroidota bacterium]